MKQKRFIVRGGHSLSVVETLKKYRIPLTEYRRVKRVLAVKHNAERA